MTSGGAMMIWRCCCLQPASENYARKKPKWWNCKRRTRRFYYSTRWAMDTPAEQAYAPNHWSSHGRPRAWARGRLLLSPGKVERCYRVTKLHIRSQFERPRRCLSAKKTVNDCLTPILFLYTIKELCVVVLVFWRRTSGCRTCPPDLGLGSQC